MPILPDDRFESYLKQFRPLTPEPMQVGQRKLSRWPSRKTATWAAVAAAVIVSFLLAFRFLRQPGSDYRSTEKIVAPYTENPLPLTIGSGNALLSHAPSFQAAVDELASPPRTIPLPQGKQSALKALSQENTKL